MADSFIIPRSTLDFIDSVGVGVHLTYYDTVYGNYNGIIRPSLVELGVRHIRDGNGGDNGDLWNKLGDLYANVGIKTTFVADYKNTLTKDNIVPRLSPISHTLAGIEGANEWDVNSPSYNGVTFPDNIRQYHTDIYNALKNSALSSIPVLTPAMAFPSSTGIVGSLPGEYAAMHYYSSGKDPMTDMLTVHIPAMSRIAPGKPIIITETGYTNGTTNLSQGRVSEDRAAKYIPRALLEYFSLGVKRTFIYELINEWSGTGQESNFGLLRNDGTRKPAYNAVRSLLRLLRDTVQPPVLLPLPLRIEGNCQYVLFQHSNGTYFLAVWRRGDSNEYQVRTPITLRFSSELDVTVQEYDLLSGLAEVYPNVKTVSTYAYDSVTVFKITMPSLRYVLG